MTDERDAELLESARREVDAATDAAEAAPFPPDDDVMERVFEEMR
jgi:TPP-dependent pyruvate/acetoin dehydrogenase alpha subunit